MTPGEPVTIRLAGTWEGAALAQLAELDSATTPPEPVLVAELAGEVLAAISLTDGTLVANPFRYTADVVELLRARERQLRGGRRRWRSASPAPWRRLRAPLPG